MSRFAESDGVGYVDLTEWCDEHCGDDGTTSDDDLFVSPQTVRNLSMIARIGTEICLLVYFAHHAVSMYRATRIPKAGHLKNA